MKIMTKLLLIVLFFMALLPEMYAETCSEKCLRQLQKQLQAASTTAEKKHFQRLIDNTHRVQHDINKTRL